MKKILFIILVLSADLVLASGKSCINLKTEAEALIENINKLMSMKVTITYLTKPNSGSGSTVLSIADSNAAHKDLYGNETIQLPDPCLLKELPTIDFWALIIAHEYSHKIIDSDGDECFAEGLHLLNLNSTEEKIKATYIDHANIYVVAMKFLNHLGYNYRKAILDFKNWNKLAKEELGSESYEALLKTASHLEENADSTFNEGSDVLAGTFFGGLKLMRSMLIKNFPDSLFWTQIENRIQAATPKCLIFSNDDVKSAIDGW